MITQNTPSHPYDNPRIDNDSQSYINKSQENSVANTMKLRDFVEKRQVEELSNLLEKEKIQKASLNAGLNIALLNSRGNGDMIGIIDVLLAHGADVNYHLRNPNKNTVPKIDEKDNVTILMFACLKGDLQLIQVILSHHPEVNIKDKNNKTALLCAILADKADNVDIIIALIHAGIDINEYGRVEHFSTNGTVCYVTHSPLTLATTKNFKNTAKILLDQGADVNFTIVPDDDTALHLAVRNGNLDIIHLLLTNKNVNLQAINKEDKTPYALALSKSQTEIYRILIERVKMNEEASCDFIGESTALSMENSNMVRKANQINVEYNQRENDQQQFENEDANSSDEDYLNFENTTSGKINENRNNHYSPNQKKGGSPNQISNIPDKNGINFAKTVKTAHLKKQVKEINRKYVKYNSHTQNSSLEIPI